MKFFLLSFTVTLILFKDVLIVTAYCLWVSVDGIMDDMMFLWTVWVDDVYEELPADSNDS